MCGSGGSSSSGNKPEGEEDGGGDGDVSSKATVEAVLFSEAAEQNLLVTGSLEGVVNVWDISSQVRTFFKEVIFVRFADIFADTHVF